MENLPPTLNDPIVSYPYGSTDYPVVTSYHHVFSKGYVALAKWSAHPDTARFPDHILIEQKNWDEAGNYVKRVYEKMPGPAFAGQTYDGQLGAAIQFTEQITKAGLHLGDAYKNITPIDQSTQKVRTMVEPTTALGAYAKKIPDSVDISVPPVLVSLAVVWETSVGEGTGDSTGSATGTNDLSLSLSNSAQGSATVMPDLQPVIKTFYGRDVPVTRCFFQLPMPVTLANILDRLADTDLMNAEVLAWPVFKPVSHTFTLIGQRVSLSGSANAQQHCSGGGSGYNMTTGSGSNLSEDKSSSVKSVTLPPTIHDAIDLTTDYEVTKTSTAEVSVVAEVDPLGDFWPSTGDSAAGTLDATGSVSPTTLDATSPAEVPTSGLKLLRFTPRINPDWPNWVMFDAIVFDAANLV